MTERRTAAKLRTDAWVVIGSGRFQWGDRWKLRARVSREEADHQCLNLRPQEPSERRCPSGNNAGNYHLGFDRIEQPCDGTAVVWGALNPREHDVKLVTLDGMLMETHVWLIHATKQRTRYVVAEVRTSRADASGTVVRPQLGAASVRDDRGRETRRVRLDSGANDYYRC